MREKRKHICKLRQQQTNVFWVACEYVYTQTLKQLNYSIFTRSRQLILQVNIYTEQYNHLPGYVEQKGVNCNEEDK